MPRLFIGIKMPEKIEKLVLAWSRDKQDWPVRWIKAKNLHLTLVPPFYEDDPERIIKKLGGIEPPPVMALHFHTLSYGPRPGEYRLIWAVGEPSPESEKLKAEIEKTLALKIERRKFLPHLTLARFRAGEVPKFAINNLNKRIDWRVEVKSFVLFESVLASGGAEYGILKSFKK